MNPLPELRQSLPFHYRIDPLGDFTIQRLTDPTELSAIHGWLKRDYARFWGMQTLSEQALRRELITRDGTLTAVGYFRNRLVFMVQFYDPATEEIGAHYAVQPGDLGMHFIVRPRDDNARIPGLTRAILQAIVACAFHGKAVSRLVVEPDINNHNIHPLNRFAGFRYQGRIGLSGKTASLGFCFRGDAEQALQRHPVEDRPRVPHEIKSFSVPLDAWQQANRFLVRKIIAEFSHERLIAPQPMNTAHPVDYRFELRLADDAIRYCFSARRYQLDHLDIDEHSIEKNQDGQPCELDALALILELKNQLGIPETLLPIYLEEVTSTLYSRACWFNRPPPDTAQLASAGYQTLEANMIEGHPVFIANSGRIGFDAEDYQQYAPETGSRLKPVWLALHLDKVTRAALKGWSFPELYQRELGENTLKRFDWVLTDLGLASADYQFMPVHPWQWKEKIARAFAADIARRDIVYLGESEDWYQPQQSIRTLFNHSTPGRCYVKTALSVLNMGFMRGLSPDYMARTPAINQWVANLVEGDRYFSDKGFRILKEVAAVGYRNRDFEAGSPRHSPYRKMLSTIWRESPSKHIRPEQTLMTMAALLHRDGQGRALVAELIHRSGLSAEHWVAQYLDVYLKPLLHSFFAYDLVFMPHGENLILIMEDHRPVGAFMKDIGEEVAVLNGRNPLPLEVADIAITLDEDMKINYIFLDIFDCFFRFLVPLLDTHAGLPESTFWRLVADAVQQYQADHPQYSEQFKRYDLFRADFVRTCLNRIQLNNNQQMIDLDDREKNLQLQGTLANPLAAFGSDTPRTTEAFRNEKPTLDALTKESY